MPQPIIVVVAPFVIVIFLVFRTWFLGNKQGSVASHVIPSPGIKYPLKFRVKHLPDFDNESYARNRRKWCEANNVESPRDNLAK